MMKKAKILAPLMMAAVILTACSSGGSAPDNAADDPGNSVSSAESTAGSVPDEETEEPDAVTPPETGNTPAEDSSDPSHMRAEFTNGMPSGFEASDGWSNGSMFNVTWRKSNVTFDGGNMQLIIDNDTIPTAIPYSGGEFRSKGFYGYGRYEVSMKAIKNDGVVSSFFTYTGPSDHNPWDEIDVEILGKDTTKVQFNYFTDSRGSHEYMYDLGFDASEDFHTYGFEWHDDKIVWFVDGEEVHTAEKNIPSTPGKIMMNAWCGTGVDGWLNAFDDSSLPIAAEYQWIKFTPFEE